MKKNDQKGISESLIIVLIVIILVAAVGIGWWVSTLRKEADTNINTNASKTVTSAWKTYSNGRFGYSIEYPDDLPLDTSDPDIVTIGNVPEEPASGFMAIIVMESEDFSFITDYKEEITNEPTTDCPEEFDVSVGGESAKSVVCIEQSGGSEIQSYFIEKNNNLYQIFWVRGDSDFDQIFEKMLDTLQFTEIIINLNGTTLNLNINSAASDRDSDRISKLRQIQTALELYYDDHESLYPAAGSWDELNTALSPYLQGGTPNDPLTENLVYYYAYGVSSSQENYLLHAFLEASYSSFSSDIDGDIDLTGVTWVKSKAGGEDPITCDDGTSAPFSGFCVGNPE